MERTNIIIIIFALVALLVVLLTRKVHQPIVETKPAIADNDDMLQHGYENAIVGNSNPGEINPVRRATIANTPWRRALGLPALRQTSRGKQLISTEDPTPDIGLNPVYFEESIEPFTKSKG